jgi:hypothetical protein
VAAALLLDKERRTMQAALNNPQMTEAWIIKALRTESGTEQLAPAVGSHPKWAHRHEVKVALLANRNTPAARLQQLAQELPLSALKDILRHVRLAPGVKERVKAVLEKRLGG